MECDKKSRLRAPNFTHNESLLLCEVLEKYKSIIENKKTDGASLQEKHQAWLKVVEEYNSLTTTFSRTLESLQQCYKNLKKKAKKQLSASKMLIPVDKEVLIQNIEQHGENWEIISDSVGVSQETCHKTFESLKKDAKKQENDLKKHVMGTGGGPSNPPKTDPILEKVSCLAGPTMDGLYTIYDGDSTLMASQGTTSVEASNIDGHKKNDSEEDSALFTNNRSNLKRKPHSKLTTSNKVKNSGKESVGEKFKYLAQEKLTLVTSQKDLISRQIEIEDEKLKQMKMQTQLLSGQLAEQEETFAHNRKVRSLELEELKKKIGHNEFLRKQEIENVMGTKKD